MLGSLWKFSFSSRLFDFLVIKRWHHHLTFLVHDNQVIFLFRKSSKRFSCCSGHDKLLLSFFSLFFQSQVLVLFGLLLNSEKSKWRNNYCSWSKSMPLLKRLLFWYWDLLSHYFSLGQINSIGNSFISCTMRQEKTFRCGNLLRKLI